MADRGVRMSNWWVGLPCRWCGQPVRPSRQDGSFHYGLKEGRPWAEHHACKDVHSPHGATPARQALNDWISP